MNENAELLAMQKEWRDSTTAAIHGTAEKVDKILEQMSEMRKEFVTGQQLNVVANRVTGLEHDRQKIIGAAFVLNAIGALILYLVSKFWK